jgi:hypothetical protein
MRAMLLLPCVLGFVGLSGCEPYSGGPDISPLIMAARQGSAGEIARLIRKGADPDQPGGVNGWTPLMHAVHKEQLASAKALIDNGAAVNLASPRAVTPLMMAAGYGDTAIVKLLLRSGADPRKQDNDGKTALDYAVVGETDIDKFTLGNCQANTVRAILDEAPDLRLAHGAFGMAARLFAHMRGCTAVTALLSRR